MTDKPQNIQKIRFFWLFFTLFCVNSFAEDITLKQVLRDGANGIDGLDNPRQVKLSPDGKYAFVSSADDNALLVLSLSDQLTPIKLFKNTDNSGFKLEGANGIALFNNAQSAAVSSFYDSAISLYHLSDNGSVNYKDSWSDSLGYERIFKSKEPLMDVDKLGLLGASDIIPSANEEQLFIASYQSNAVSIFDIKTGGKLTFYRKITSLGVESSALGRPVSLAFSSLQHSLVIAGYEENKLSILSITPKGPPKLLQTISNDVDGIKDLIRPHKVILSASGKTMYVACSGSHAIIVFQLVDQRFVHLQSITHKDTKGKGLTGVASIELSHDGERLYAAGEMDSGLLRFDVAADGSLEYRDKIQFKDSTIEGVTSIATTDDDKHLLMTLGKMDALYLLEIHK